ncbi:DUF7504 family protein [Halocatena marina]|uniref:DUF7504 family protein n=1 Tax=Halocatena marina TaxID=2934937 RepID=UPI002223FA73|nr:hypothetical protein [Halocatena marina]
MDGENETRAFARSLSALKQRGCNLLIAGPVRDGTHLELSRQLMGTADAESRWRLVVATDSYGVGTRCSETTDADTYRVIDHRPAMRSAAISANASSPLDVSALEREMLSAIDDFDVAAEGLSPGELRVCVDSLRPLVDMYGTNGIESFLDTVTERIGETNGMGHFHLPVELECEVVSELMPQFDILIELRPGKHRWHLTEDDILTDWLPV